METFALIMLAILLFFGEKISESRKSKKNAVSKAWVKIPRNSGEYPGHDYMEVKEELQAYGFTNIFLQQKKNFLTGRFIKEGAVATVSISGKTCFLKGQLFPPSVRVVITYHSLLIGPDVPTPARHAFPVEAEVPPACAESPAIQSSRFQDQTTAQAPLPFKCKNCCGTMEYHFDQGLAVCPYCDSTEVLAESDAVKMERLRQKERTETQARAKEESRQKETH